MEQILLPDDEIANTIQDIECAFSVKVTATDRGIAQAQVNHLVKLLKDSTVEAWGGNRVILDEDWRALLEAVKKDKKGGKR